MVILSYSTPTKKPSITNIFANPHDLMKKMFVKMCQSQENDGSLPQPCYCLIFSKVVNYAFDLILDLQCLIAQHKQILDSNCTFLQK